MSVGDPFSGSTGTIPAERVRQVISRWRADPNASSASFMTLWNDRNTIFRVPERSYIIGGGEENTSTGWWNYHRRLRGSTRNTSSGGIYGVLGLPDQSWRDFEASISGLQPDGTTDADHGRRVYALLTQSDPEIGDDELLSVWGGRGTSDAGSS